MTGLTLFKKIYSVLRIYILRSIYIYKRVLIVGSRTCPCCSHRKLLRLLRVLFGCVFMIFSFIFLFHGTRPVWLGGQRVASLFLVVTYVMVCSFDLFTRYEVVFLLACRLPGGARPRCVLLYYSSASGAGYFVFPSLVFPCYL